MRDFEAQGLALANDLIAEFGQQVTWTTVQNQEPEDPSQSWIPSGTGTTRFYPTLVFLPSDRKLTKHSLMFMEGGEVPDGYETALMAGNVGFVPKLRDMVTRGNSVVAVQWIDCFNPAGTPLIYKLGLLP